MLKTFLLFLFAAAIIVSAAENGNQTPVVPDSDEHIVAKGEPPASPDLIDPQRSASNIVETSHAATTAATTLPPISTTPPSPEPTSAPTPAPAPTPVPPPEKGRWIVNGSDETCIIAQMAVQFNVTYTTKDNKKAHQVLNLPANNTVVEGTCGSSNNTEQNLTIAWNSSVSSNTSNAMNNLTFHFVKNATKNQYTLHHLEVSFVPEEFPGISPNYSTSFAHHKDEFTTGLSNSYRCLKLQTFNLTGADNETAGEIRISNLQFQAFHTENTTNFGFAEDCAFDTPDIVPIAVGCALAVLVVIVLIAYLIGRRRSQARGYLSM